MENNMSEEKKRYKKITQGLISSIQDTDRLGFAGAMGIGPWVVPLAPAIIFGWALYESAPESMGNELRIIAGSAAAIGLIVAGAVSSHNAISLQTSNIKGKILAFAWTLVFGYIALEIAGLWKMSIEREIKIVGTVISLLTLVVYLSRSAASRLTEIKQDKAQAQQLEREDDLQAQRLEREAKEQEEAHRREMEKLRLQMEQDTRLATIEASKEKAIAKAKLSVPKSVSGNVSGDTLILSPAEQNDRILHYMEQNPDTTLTQLAQDVGTSRSTLYRRLEKLKAAGKIKVNGAGYTINR